VIVGIHVDMRRTRSLSLALGLLLPSALLALSCGSNGTTGTGTGGTSGGAGTTGSAGATGSAGTTGNAGTTGSAGTSAAGTAGASGTTGAAGTSAAGGSSGTTGGAGRGGAGGSAAGGSSGTTGGAGRGGAGGSAAGGSAGGGAGGRGGAGGTGQAGTGGRGGAGGTTGTAGAGGSGGSTTCSAGHALSLSSNGTGGASDSALSRVEVDLGTDLPIGNSKRTIEFWAYIKTTDWVGDKNELYYYGGSASAASFGMDFGTNPVMGMASNHATLNPFTGGLNDDSTNYLGITSSSDQWVHIAEVWDGTNLLTYVNGALKITTPSGTGGITALATAQSVLTIGCNPSNSACFNGLFDEFQVWNVARTATEIQNSYNKPAVGNETGLVGYWKFDESSGTMTADAVTAAGHTAHNGTLKADTAAHDPTFVTPPVALPLVCN
jgi:hypothetical protein